MLLPVATCIGLSCTSVPLETVPIVSHNNCIHSNAKTQTVTCAGRLEALTSTDLTCPCCSSETHAGHTTVRLLSHTEGKSGKAEVKPVCEMSAHQGTAPAKSLCSWNLLWSCLPSATPPFRLSAYERTCQAMCMPVWGLPCHSKPLLEQRDQPWNAFLALWPSCGWGQALD